MPNSVTSQIQKASGIPRLKGALQETQNLNHLFGKDKNQKQQKFPFKNGFLALSAP